MNKKVLFIAGCLIVLMGIGAGFGLAKLTRGSSSGVDSIVGMPGVFGVVWDSHDRCERCMLNVYLTDLHKAAEVKSIVDAAFVEEGPGVYIRKADRMEDLQVTYSVDDLLRWRKVIQGPVMERVSVTLMSTDQNAGRIIIGVPDLSVAAEVEEVFASLDVPIGVLALIESNGITLTARSFQ